VHKFHKIVATSKAMAIRGTVDASGLKHGARAVATFTARTQPGRALIEVVEGEKYRVCVVRISVPGFKLPTSG